jgi:hypothetical protein
MTARHVVLLLAALTMFLSACSATTGPARGRAGANDSNPHDRPPSPTPTTRATPAVGTRS